MTQVTVSITALQAQKLLHAIQRDGEAFLKFKEKGQKGGFWGAVASTLLPMALPLVEKGIGALVNKIGGGGHGIPITCTKCQMQKIRQCGSGGLKINFKIRSPGRSPSPAVSSAVQNLQGSGLFDSIRKIIPMIIRVAKPVGKALAKAGIAAGKHLLKKGAEKAADKGAEYLEKKLAGETPLDLNLFPNAPTGDTRPVHGLFPPPDPQGGQGLKLSGRGLKLAGKGLKLAGKGSKKKNPAVDIPKRFIIKRV